MTEFLIEAGKKIATTALAIFSLIVPSLKPTLPPAPIYLVPEKQVLKEIPSNIADPFSLTEPLNPLETVKNIEKQNLPLIRIKNPNPPFGQKHPKPAPTPQIRELEFSSDPILANWQKINSRVTQSIVNLFCTSREGNAVRTMTGSGVIIDPRGIILTNAHIAQHFLRSNENCGVRQGSPVQGNLKAKVLFINSEWLSMHSDEINNPHPTGTGEFDYALLAIQKPNQTFSALETTENLGLLFTGEQVITAGYPAPLSLLQSGKNPSYLSAILPIQDTYGFSSYENDLLFFGGSLVAEQGSSGGPVVNNQGKLIGILVTATPAKTIDEREARAISLPYIMRNFKEETGKTFGDF